MVLAITAIQNEEMATLAQAAAEDLFAHNVPGVRDIDSDEEDSDHLSIGTLHRLILRDIALSEEQGQAAIDLTFGYRSIGRTGDIQHRTHRSVAILFTQRGRHAHKIISAADKQGRDSPRARKEIIRRRVVFMQLGLTTL